MLRRQPHLHPLDPLRLEIPPQRHIHQPRKPRRPATAIAAGSFLFISPLKLPTPLMLERQ
ncbi:MAG: hypothetical protein U0841_19745 [Chloroflexia bacterium]